MTPFGALAKEAAVFPFHFSYALPAGTIGGWREVDSTNQSIVDLYSLDFPPYEESRPAGPD